MKSLILARHGESTASAADICDGDPHGDVPLTPRGEQQAQQLGRDLASHPIDLSITSQFLRTRQTASIALEGRILPALVDPNLNDINYGSFEGQPLSSYRAWIDAHGVDAAPPGGETIRDVARRMLAALQALVARPEDQILVVTHEKLLSITFAAADGTPPSTDSNKFEPATAHTLSPDGVQRAIETLTSWLAGE